MLSYTDLKPGQSFIKDGEPYVVLDYMHVKKQRGAPVVQLKIKSLLTGKSKEITARQNEGFEEADIEKFPAEFIYSNRGKFVFKNPDDPSDRPEIDGELIGDAVGYLKEGAKVTIIKFRDKIVGVELPVKVDLRVAQAPPAVKGNTADGGTKLVTLETGIKIKTPLFIKEGDIIRINTEKGEYSERVG